MPPKFYKQSLPNLQIADSSYFIQMIQSLEIEKSTTHFMKCITYALNSHLRKQSDFSQSSHTKYVEFRARGSQILPFVLG